ncbi:hypothetical protein ACP4OV_025004 [Aristida adscensionis]
MAAATALLVSLLSLAVLLRGSEGAWCVCRADASEAALQQTLDYACGHGADCAAVLPSGACHDPDSVRAHCSYAANSYYQRNSQASGATCDFGGTATLTNTDPSSGTCKYPATSSAAGTSGGSAGGAGTSSGSAGGAGTSSPGSSTTPTTMGGSFTTPVVGASGPAPITVSAAAATFDGRHGVLIALASVLASLMR